MSIEALTAVYRRIPRLICRGQCQSACGHIGALPLEIQEMTRRGGPFVFHATTERCGYLDEMSGRCRVYEQRPLMCRAFGVVDELRCPYGCEPERMMTREEQQRAWDQLKQVAGDEGYTAEVVL